MYKELLDEKYPEGTQRPTEDFDPELWAQVTNPKKGYVKGVGYTSQRPVSTAVLDSQSSASRPLTAEQLEQCVTAITTSRDACVRIIDTFRGLSAADYAMLLDRLVQRRDEALERERERESATGGGEVNSTLNPKLSF